jgi:hypothetical protein
LFADEINSRNIKLMLDRANTVMEYNRRDMYVLENIISNIDILNELILPFKKKET